MRDLSLHLMDLVQNSITAGAALIKVSVFQKDDGLLGFMIEDDGCGMDEETREKALSPFGTSRTTRKVGLGIPLTREHALITGGSFDLESKKGQGTSLQAVFNTRHIDCQPLGNLGETLLTLILANPDTPDFVMTLSSEGAQESLDTRQIKEVLGEVPINDPAVVTWLMENINEMLNQTLGGVEK
ncbi:MAG: ATP-binding protein [Bacillota bacterium]|nr:ATP-binding protein [Bacillota bacterium]